jgi:Molybdopterin-guanine dinucleotide biosynthesis protein A
MGFDRIEGEGPLPGIADSLILLPAHAGRVFVLPCVLPFLSHRWIGALDAAFTVDWDAVCTHSGYIPHALLALYRPQVLL